MSRFFDFIVVGAGMAGSAIAAHLSESASVLLIEAEEQPGYHSTGRSAALFAEMYGNDLVRAITRASRDFFFNPPSSFTAVPLVRERPVLLIAGPDEEKVLDAFIAAQQGGGVERLTIDEAIAFCPILRRDQLTGAALSRGTADIEVHELQQGYLRLLKARGGKVKLRETVSTIDRSGGAWQVTTSGDTYSGKVVVNAAGAWAGKLGRRAGAVEIGLQPTRRTAILVNAPANLEIDKWPMVLNVSEDLYFKPDAGLLLLSPADESNCEAGDARAEELDVAIAVDKFERATEHQVRRISHRWAGLRSFVADRSPVVGYDPVQPNFFWFAALGGYGIQTAPAISRIAAALARRLPVDTEILAHGVDIDLLNPHRLFTSVDA